MTLGEKIVVNVRLFGCTNGQLLGADQFVVDQPADILTRVDLLADKVAGYLGALPRSAQPAALAEAMTHNLEAYRYYSLGVTKAQTFQNAQAMALLRKAIQLDPKFVMAYARIGYAYSVTDFLPEKGRPFLAKAMELSDHLTPKDRLYVTAWYAIARQDYPAAIRTMRQIIDEYSLETEAYTRLARLLYSEERPQQSIAVVRRGLAVDAEYPDLYNVLGVCFLGLGRYDEAIAAHQRYLQLAPNEPNAHDSLGMSFQQSGKYDRAVAEFNSALSQDPEFEPAIIHLGDAFSQQGRYRDAIHQYRRYIQVTGSDTARAIGYGSLVQIYERLHDFSRADRLKARSSRIAPYPARGVRNELRSYEHRLGTLALREKQPEQAIAHFQAALRHLPPSSGMDLYEDCLANAYLELHRLPQAINEYERILGLNPNYPFAHYHLAQAFERSGQFERARTTYERFLEVWRNADADIPEVLDARKQLLVLPVRGGERPQPKP
jgi:tetratricopeptide (TPR) repeat protein